MRSGWEVENGGCLVLVGCFFYDLGAPGRARSLVKFKEVKGKSSRATHNLREQCTWHGYWCSPSSCLARDAVRLLVSWRPHSVVCPLVRDLERRGGRVGAHLGGYLTFGGQIIEDARTVATRSDCVKQPLA